MAARAVDRRSARAVLANDHRESLVEPVENLGQSECLLDGHNRKNLYSLWNLPLDVSWTPDFWGKIRNEVHEAQYAAQVSAADLELEKLTEQASLAEYFFEIRGQDMLQQILNENVAADQKIARL